MIDEKAEQCGLLYSLLGDDMTQRLKDPRRQEQDDQSLCQSDGLSLIHI